MSLTSASMIRSTASTSISTYAQASTSGSVVASMPAYATASTSSAFSTRYDDDSDSVDEKPMNNKTNNTSKIYLSFFCLKEILS